MLIIFRPYGNHTNQIYQFIQGDIFAKIHNLQFDCYFVYNFFSFFPNLKNKYKSFKTLCVFPILSFMYKILNRFHLIKTFDVSDLKICQKMVVLVLEQLLVLRNCIVILSLGLLVLRFVNNF